MANKTVSDEEFIEMWRTLKSAAAICQKLGIQERAVHSRRRRIEGKYAIKLEAKDFRTDLWTHRQTAHEHAARHHLGIENGTVIVFSDAHFWPGIRTTAFKGLLWAIKELKPKAVINNGDAFDGAAISRFPRVGWDSKPSVIEELKACDMYLGEIDDEAKRAYSKAKLVWALGNHDARFENRLANTVPEFMAVGGFKLKDHFPAWIPCWSCWPTEDVVVKHRMKGGIHATHNNAVSSGKTIVTGHLHSLKVTPYSDYNGERFGVDTGTLADTGGPQFVDYLEDNPTNWRSGFAVLTFHNGRLLWPELAHALAPGAIQFRGQVINVSKL
jgi:hypothetical protein